MTPPRAMQSDYMHWAKFKVPVRYALTTSEVPHVHLDALGVSISDLELDGASHPRYLPLRQRIAARYGVGAERVVYGSDVGGRSFSSQLAKTLGANVPDSAKKLILGGNLRRMLAPILRAKGFKD